MSDKEQKSNEELVRAINKLGKLELDFSFPRIVYNNFCVKCDKTEREMVKVGAVIFCHNCYTESFKTDDPVKKEKKVYGKYLQIYKRKCTEL